MLGFPDVLRNQRSEVLRNFELRKHFPSSRCASATPKLCASTRERQCDNQGAMSRQFLLFIIVCLVLGGCTALVSSDYQQYEGRNNVHEGTGGTKVVVDGVDFWANGSPPRKFAILGVVTSDVGAGFGDQALIRSSVASRVKHVGGDAAVQITNNTTFSGIVHFAPNIYTATSTRTMSFAIIKYVH